ncbi:protein aurora borealis isoform X2 [Synchiropus splendidus]|uniref:protein aurora borealis isoform X2 n=1 Tax=Synchiropus splendidus TaxID=270530 RepID=UPI00237EE667|nr:protein aurora borealis isoform X2 [Synchiropus splendidus]
MGDHANLQITPETPGRPLFRNPFESPNDYRHLREPVVPSPSVFKSRPSKPILEAKLNWSIDELASLLPVHIDPEEINQQSLYLSQTRADSDIEEKRQDAIEQFFTKGIIVPSPWADSNARIAAPLLKKSPLTSTEPEKLSVACQTTLSLPLAFDLEKLLGEYYCNGEPCDAVQESLSSSSLRRKLFLDGQSSPSGSHCSTPPSPEHGPASKENSPLSQEEPSERDVVAFEGGAVSSIFSSPTACRALAPTPSTGQFSSSPIHNGGFRDCSLGNSPLFPDRSSPAGLSSPTLSPIFSNALRTPKGSDERRQQCRVTPLGVPLDMDVHPCSENPYVEGCSPIRSCSPLQLPHNSRTKPRTRLGCWASPPIISPILNPKLQDCPDMELHLPSSSHPSMDLDPTSPVTTNMQPMDSNEVTRSEDLTATKMQMRLEEDDEVDAGGLPSQLTSSRMGNMSAVENSQMFMSSVDGSSIRCDSSMQVDSGYSTTSTGTTGVFDGFSADSQSKESFTSMHTEDTLQLSKHSKVKVYFLAFFSCFNMLLQCLGKSLQLLVLESRNVFDNSFSRFIKSRTVEIN